MGVKHFIHRSFFNTWSDDMAYILGFIYADGSLHDSHAIRGKYIRIGSTDIDRVELIKSATHSSHSIKTEKRGIHKDFHLLQIGSAHIYAQLEKIGLYPNKSLSIKMPSIPKKFLSQFILGYFDGDGCVYTEISPKGRPKRLRIIFTSGSTLFLKNLQQIVEKQYNLQGKIYEQEKERAVRLIYNTRQSIILFEILYSSYPNYLKRKFDQFVKYFKLRPEHITKNIQRIIKV